MSEFGGDDGGGRNTLVVFLTHITETDVARRYERLRSELPSDHDLLLAFDETDSINDRARDAYGLDQGEQFTFTFREVRGRLSEYPHPWPGDQSNALVPGNVDLLLLYLHRLTSAYDRYWLVEYDVVYTGHWATLFGYFDDNDSALLGTTLQESEIKPDWHWWDSLKVPTGAEPSSRMKGFFPLMRLTADGLEALDDAYRAGWSGHSEAVLPTVLRHRGLRIEDIGGKGPFVSPENVNRFYTNTPWSDGLSPGTFVYRPGRRYPGMRPDMLWHPVKPTEGRLSSTWAHLRRWLQVRLLESPPPAWTERKGVAIAGSDSNDVSPDGARLSDD